MRLSSLSTLVAVVAGTAAIAVPIPGVGARASLGTTSVSRSMASGSAVSCYAYDVADGTGDTSGGLDATHLELSYDCIHKTWTATATTSQGFANSQLGLFELDFDTDGNFSNNCDGTEWAVLVGYVPEAGGILGNAVRFSGSCDGGHAGEPYATRSSAHTISMTWPDWFGGTRPQRFHTVAYLTGSQHPQNSDFDRIPSSNSLLGQRSTSVAFSPHTGASVYSSYTQVVGGDFNGDGYSDVLFYGAGSAPDSVWRGKSGETFTSSSIAIWGTYTLIPGDFDGDGVTDLLLYAKGSAPDAVWYGSHAGTFTSVPLAINGDYQIVAGDFDGDGRDDLLFYAPGTPSDYVWSGQANRTFQSMLVPAINNPYRIAAGDFNGDGHDDVLLYAPGSAPDHVMQGGTTGHFTFTDLSIGGDYSTLRPGDFNGDGADDVLLFNPGTGSDALWRGSYSAPDLVAGSGTVINEDYAASVVGDFDRNGTDDLYLFAPGAIPESIWYGVRTPPTQLYFKTFGDIAVDPANGHVFVTSGEHGTQMAVLDAHGALVKSMTGLNGPTGVAFGASTVFVAMTGGQTIGEFDRSTLAPTGTIDVGASHWKPLSLAYQHGKLWFTYAHGLGVWDPGTSTVSTAATDVTQRPVLASGTDGTDTLVVSSSLLENTDFARYDISGGSAVLAKFRSGTGTDPGSTCVDATVSPDGQHVWLSCADPGYIVELDTATLADTTGHYDSGTYPDAVTTTGMRGGWVVGGVDGFDWKDVYLDRIGSSTTVRAYELNSTVLERGLAMSPDGRFVYAVSTVQKSTSGPALVNVLPVP